MPPLTWRDCALSSLNTSAALEYEIEWIGDEMINPSKMARLVLNLAWLEFKAQRKDTFLGWGWIVLWPALQAGGLLLVVGILRGETGVISLRTMLATYLGVLVWSTAVGVIMGNLGILQTHREMIVHIRFPFIVLPVVDVTVKYLVFLTQLLIGVGLWLFLVPHATWGLMLADVMVFVVIFYLALIATAWIVSLLGLAAPDLSFVLPPLFLFLLTLSPIFHSGQEALSPFVRYLNNVSPLSFVINSWYAAIDVYGTGSQFPWVLLIGAVVALAGAYKLAMAMYREVAKVL
jgi:ABC-type polysaccharide/polyol phosphate export permease